MGPPFSSLDIIMSKGSSGKYWVFHLNPQGIIKGFLFPGGYRIMRVRPTNNHAGEFFIENRNFLKSSYGLLAAIIPNKAEVVKIHKCELILVAKIFVDKTE